MLDHIILAPDLEVPHGRVLKAQLQAAGLPTPPPLHTWEQVDATPNSKILSVGKAALDLWHEYGLVRVGDHHGVTFQTRGRQGVGSRGRLYDVMVVEHPGTLMQQSFIGHSARDHMARDLMHWRKVLEGRLFARDLRGKWCVRCAGAKRVVYKREACEWDARVDGVGLCEDHWRSRAKIQRVERVKKVNRSSKEGQMKGQMEMVPDGRHIMVTKN